MDMALITRRNRLTQYDDMVTVHLENATCMKTLEF